jgi:type IV secretion system protein TrbB
VTASDVRSSPGLPTVTAAESVSGSLRTVTRAIRPYFGEPRVIEIMLNPDGRIWVGRTGEGMSLMDTTMSPAEAEAFLRVVRHRVASDSDG